MMDNMDSSKLDKVEGVEARNKAVFDLRNRLSKFHPASPEYQKHSDERLNDCKLPAETLEWDEALEATAKVILREWKHTFSITPKNPGTARDIMHEIVLKEGEIMPKPLPMFRQSLPHRNLIADWVRWMLTNKMIRRSKATSFQNLLVIEKPGREPRVCFDARAVNDVTVPDQYPPHRMDTLFAKLKHSTVFSALDAASGFWQIPVKKEDQAKTAFRVEGGVYEFLVMPLGLRNAPATFQ
jgi:hypothetical protein